MKGKLPNQASDSAKSQNSQGSNRKILGDINDHSNRSISALVSPRESIGKVLSLKLNESAFVEKADHFSSLGRSSNNEIPSKSSKVFNIEPYNYTSSAGPSKGDDDLLYSSKTFTDQLPMTMAALSQHDYS